MAPLSEALLEQAATFLIVATCYVASKNISLAYVIVSLVRMITSKKMTMMKTFGFHDPLIAYGIVLAINGQEFFSNNKLINSRMFDGHLYDSSFSFIRLVMV